MTYIYCCVYSARLLMMGQRNYPKLVEFYSKNKFEDLVYLVGFIIRIYQDARSSECQIFPAVVQVFYSDWCLTLQTRYHSLRYDMFDSLGFWKRYLCTCILYLYWEHTPTWRICSQSQQVKLAWLAPSLNKRICLKIRSDIPHFAVTHNTSITICAWIKTSLAP
jgi:hypothetical protein